MAKQEVEKKPENSALAVPDFMKSDRGKGMEGVSNEDVAIPRISLLQALSEQCQTGAGRPGEFYHVLAEENMGTSFRMIPIIVKRSFLLWRPRDQGGGLLARADDGMVWNPSNTSFDVMPIKGGEPVTWSTKGSVAESKLADWGTAYPKDPTSLPAATKLMNILVWLPDFEHLSPSIYSLQRSSIKPGKALLGRLKMSAAPSFGHIIKVGSADAQNNKGEKYKAPSFAMDGFVSEQALYHKLNEMYEHFSTTTIKVDERGLDQEEPSGGDGGGAGSTHGKDEF